MPSYFGQLGHAPLFPVAALHRRRLPLSSRLARSMARDPGDRWYARATILPKCWPTCEAASRLDPCSTAPTHPARGRNRPWNAARGRHPRLDLRSAPGRSRSSPSAPCLSSAARARSTNKQPRTPARSSATPSATALGRRSRTGEPRLFASGTVSMRMESFVEFEDLRARIECAMDLQDHVGLARAQPHIADHHVVDEPAFRPTRAVTDS